MKKFKYEAPVVMNLGEMATGIGATCNPAGSSAGSCNGGASGSMTGCNSGTTPTCTTGATVSSCAATGAVAS